MRSLPAILSCIVFAASAAADEVHLKDGSILSGKLALEGERYTVVDRDRKFVVPKADVAKVVRAKSLMEEYEERLAALAADDAEAIYELGRWLEQNDWESRARLVFEEVLEIDPDHKGARRALGHKLFEGEWVSPDEINRRSGLVEYRGRWYTKHDLAELQRQIEKSEEVRGAFEEQQRVNEKVNGMLRSFATFDAPARRQAHMELYRYAEELNSPELRKFADDTLAYYDGLAKHICAQLKSRTQIRATQVRLTKPIQTFQTQLGQAAAPGRVLLPAQNPVVIQLPELRIVSVESTVDIPAGCR